jgi:hypothetical protein
LLINPAIGADTKKEPGNIPKMKPMYFSLTFTSCAKYSEYTERKNITKMIPIVVETHAMMERLFLKRLTKPMSFAPSYFFSGAFVLLTRFGTAMSYNINAIAKIPERT